MPRKNAFQPSAAALERAASVDVPERPRRSAPPRAPEVGAIPLAVKGPDLADLMEALQDRVEKLRADAARAARAGDRTQENQASDAATRAESLLRTITQAAIAVVRGTR